MSLNRDNYFSKENESLYMGSSQFKAWDQEHGGCESKQIAIINGEWEEKENESYLFGDGSRHRIQSARSGSQEESAKETCAWII